MLPRRAAMRWRRSPPSNSSLWRELAGRAIEPNGYYLPEWELAVNAFAPGRSGASMLAAWRDASPPG